MNRRHFLHQTALLSAANLLWSPSTHALTGHGAYFAKLNDLLKHQGPGRPVMLIDTERMNHNIDALTASVGESKNYRIVVKSLPSVGLLKHVSQRARTQSLMVFHQPFLNAIAEAFPRSDALLGKPMPVRAAETFYRTLPTSSFSPEHQIEWLIDTRTRLEQYLQLAQTLGIRMRCNFEIDVGLRRGGFPDPESLSGALDLALAHPERVQISGLMGYEPHLTGLEAELGHPAVQDVLNRYRAQIELVGAKGLDPQTLTLNGAGSHTLKIYEKDQTMNDLSAGSGVVMPTDFDTHHLQNHRPALFIAAPILKRYDQSPLNDKERLYYIYGGKWKATLTSPTDVGDALYESTNQSPIVTSAANTLDVDDYMFFRPTQSEFVMLQFGDLLTVTEGQIDKHWPIFHQTG